MVVFGSRKTAHSRRRALQTTTDMPYFKAEWMESGDDPMLSPTIFMVEQPPNSTVDPHFHAQNQFQLFVEGSGVIGQSAIQIVTVHYAGAYTGYGPLASGPEGIKYFTIRPVCESGANFIKDSRHKMVRGPKRHATSQPIPPLQEDERMALAGTQVAEAIPVGEDGLGARVLRLPPGTPVRTPFPKAASGTFMIVLGGSVRYDCGELFHWESVFASTEEELPVLRAGATGAEVVFLFTPAKSQAYLGLHPNQPQETT